MNTDINKIRDMAKVFLYLPIQEADNLPSFICVHHPIFSSSVVPFHEDMLDLYNKKDLERYNKHIVNMIDKSNLLSIYMLIRKPYRLTFLKYCESYLSEKDFSELFADAWVSSENPNQDANCGISYLIKAFKRCNKIYLMQKEDYEIYMSLPDTFQIYRGVAVGGNPKGLSWTRNLEKAQWFANRFNTDNEKGYVQTTIANKNNVLAYFNTRNEDEIVYDSRKSKISKI